VEAEKHVPRHIQIPFCFARLLANPSAKIIVPVIGYPIIRPVPVTKLLVETRGFKGPRAYEETGLPLHVDNQSIFIERIRRDKSNPNILHDEITSIDHALTRPWTVTNDGHDVPRVEA
jgi:hypothetical protein